MPIKVEIPTVLLPCTNGQRAVHAEGENLKQVLANLTAQHPGLSSRLLTEEGQLRRFINIYVNDQDVRYREALDYRLTDGDVVTILPAMAGGA